MGVFVARLRRQNNFSGVFFIFLVTSGSLGFPFSITPAADTLPFETTRSGTAFTIVIETITSGGPATGGNLGSVTTYTRGTTWGRRSGGFGGGGFSEILGRGFGGGALEEEVRFLIQPRTSSQ